MKVKLKLVGLDGNAFALLGAFKQAAKRQGMPEDELKKIMADAMSGDYDNLVYTLDQHCEEPQ